MIGAVMAVAFAKLFMAAYPVLLQDQTTMSAAEQPANWASTMTYKFVGVLRSLTEPKPYQMTAIWIGVAIGFAIEVARKVIKANARSAKMVDNLVSALRDRIKGLDWMSEPTKAQAVIKLDAFLLPSPYALSFGGFVNLSTSLWFGGGGIVASAINTLSATRVRSDVSKLPEDMSATSLFGGGLIAGDALAALGIGVAGLLGTLAGH